jgi:hypothetical protein
VIATSIPHPVVKPVTWRVLVAWIVLLAIVLGLVSTIEGFRGTVSEILPVSLAGADLRPNNGNARVVQRSLEVRNTPEASLTILRLPVRPFQSSDLGRLKLESGTIPADVEIALLWVRRTEPGQVHEQRLRVTRERHVATVLLDQNPEWRGEILMVALGVKGSSAESWRLDRLVLDAVSAKAVARGVMDDWLSFEKWDGRSINVVFGGRETQRLYLPIVVFIASLSTAVWLRWRQVRFVVGWIALDLRWQAELTAKTRDTWATFAGLALDARHMEMEDADLYRTIGIVKNRLQGPLERIFVGSDVEYFRMRAAYHLYPHNVLPFGWYDGKPLRSGDLVFLYQKADIRFDARDNALLWPDGSRTAVYPIYATTGAGLFRVK